eukprot:Protomagalhaensia_sp_Gyna_25__1917@NODE_2017_length_1343_cov_356_475460_g1663_i0_p1_GENE_NODE_2017_length_1343_cov_356_475460_g1663_i0NODE_2017_length_1343_cov_356_475460_g1663_i0_p1_ORF_typecomplete_len175_score13_20_NODE_2017_length_1343_cov_356_475460_g1663_i0144668
MMKGACPRADLLSSSAEQQKMRSMVARLPKYCTFDHTFHALRAEERYWFLKTKPIRHESRTPIEQYMALSAVMRRADNIDNIRKDKLKPKDYEALAKVIGSASPLSEGILLKNGLEKKPRFRTESENLRAAVNASRVTVVTSEAAPPDGPTVQKNVHPRLQQLVTTYEKRMSRC